MRPAARHVPEPELTEAELFQALQLLRRPGWPVTVAQLRADRTNYTIVHGLARCIQRGDAPPAPRYVPRMPPQQHIPRARWTFDYKRAAANDFD